MALLLIGFSGLVSAQKQPLPPLHHPVGITLPQNMQVPDDFPLGKQQELVCDTCHGVENLDQVPQAKVNTRVKNFLRSGPYDGSGKTLLDFCGNCHESRFKQKNMQRTNVHKMLDKQGKQIKKNCTYCHASVPDPVKDQDWRKLRFQISPEKLCYGCHLKTTHLNAVQHQVKPSDKVLKQMQRSEQQKQLVLPLDKRGKMMCVTCHSPHQQGVLNAHSKGGKQVAQTSLDQGIQYAKPNFWSRVFAQDKAVRWQQLNEVKGLKLPEYRPIKQEALLRLPAKDGQLCRACHVFKD